MASERVLILEDEETIRYVLRTVVTELGHEVLTAGTVTEALALVAEHRFSGALLDLVLPDGNGIEVLEAIKRSAPDTEVIIMTGHASVETAIGAIRSGAYDYIEKPCDLDVVAAAVTRALEKRDLRARNQQLLQEIEQHNVRLAATVQRLGSLNVAGMGMSQIRELPELLAFFLRLVVQELEVDRASVMLVDESGELRIAASHGIDERVTQETRVKIGEGIVGRVVETGEPILVDDLTVDSESVETPRHDLSNSFISAPIKLSVPIKSDSPLGAINVTNRRSGAPFTNEDVTYLLGLAGQAAVAIERARHFNNLQSAVESLEATRDQLEDANRRLQDANAGLNEATELKNRFLANTSHELRTPLSGILGFLELILDGACQTREGEREFLEKALQSAQKLKGLINDLLTISNIEATSLGIKRHVIDVRALFEEVRKTTEAQAAQKGLSIRFEVAAGPSVHKVWGDASKVKQVLLNLVGNSIKFTHSGSVTVCASENRDRGHCMFEIVDTGIGIPAEKRQSLFDEFRQVDGSPTRKYGGTGIGLAISKHLVELMGGVIGIESGGGNHGTRVYFSLPISRDDMEQHEAASDPPRAAGRIEGPVGGALVLVVEDDPVFRHYMAMFLNRNGHRTVEAADAGSAWMLLRRLRPSIVLIDFALPTSGVPELRSGWDLAVKINADPESQQTPVIFVTGFEAEFEIHLDEVAFVRPPACLRKPFESEHLLRQIDTMLGARSERVMRILLAGSDPAIVALVRNQVPAEHYLEVASGGEECLNVLRTQPHGFDLLLLDLSMPETTGLDVLHEMRAKNLGSDLALVVMTESPEPDDRLSAFDDRIAGVIAKPVLHANQGSLRELIERYRDQSVSTGASAASSDEFPGSLAA